MPALTLAPRAWVAAALLLAGCRRGAPVTTDECNRLLDRYTEQLARVDRPHLSAAELQRLQGETRARAASHRAFQDCPREVSREQMDCALNAWDPDATERCLIPMP